MISPRAWRASSDHETFLKSQLIRLKRLVKRLARAGVEFHKIETTPAHARCTCLLKLANPVPGAPQTSTQSFSREQVRSSTKTNPAPGWNVVLHKTSPWPVPGAPVHGGGGVLRCPYKSKGARGAAQSGQPCARCTCTWRWGTRRRRSRPQT